MPVSASQHAVSTSHVKIGVYFSANDAVLPWTMAFLNSLREFNPTLPLFLIPFNDQCEALLSLRKEYRFDVYEDDSFERLEAIGQAYELGHTPHGKYWFRRFSAFWGPLDQFMYLDARQVVLADLRPIIEAPANYGFDLLHYDCCVDQVYEPGEFRVQLLQNRYGRGFNSGRWVSRRGVFSLAELEQLGAASLQVRGQLNPRNTDQGFVNYCCDMKPVRYGHLAEVMGGICQHAWARRSGKVYWDGQQYRVWDHGGLDHGQRVVLVHWAGIGNRPNMPARRLFRKYRMLRASYLRRLLAILLDGISWPFCAAFHLVRANRFVNQVYHRHACRMLPATIPPFCG